MPKFRLIQAFLFLSIYFFLLSIAHSGDLFVYTDDKGRQHFVDSAKKVPEQYREQLKNSPRLPTISKVKPGRDKLYEERVDTNSRVEVFETSWCSICRVLKKELHKANIAFTSYDVETSTRGKNFYRNSKVKAVPITRVDGSTLIYGAAMKKIKAALSER